MRHFKQIDDKLVFNWKKELTEAFLIYLFGGILNLVLWCDCWGQSYAMVINFTYNGFFWVLLWKGSQYMVAIQDTIYSWLEKPLKRFLLSISMIVVYVVFVVYLMDLSYDLLVLGKTLSQAFEKLSGGSLVSVILITLGINAFMHGRAFLLEWRQTSIDMEKLKTEQVSTRYESLKNQVNPHFLFNSLNALTSLVYDDQAKAVEFIRRLSQVYRYVLDKKDEELVPINDEIKFMENFIFLQKIRFGENLIVHISKNSTNGHLPPLALQILVENAIKHNVVSEKDPLTIDINISDHTCVITNNIQEKLAKDSTGIGLSNLKARYQYLSKEEIEIINDQQHFTVKIPILQLEK